MPTLFCVLDWGLGHATRSLALAEDLEDRGETVVWASSGYARKVLLEALPAGTVVHQLPAYSVRYQTRNMALNVALQLPKWLRTIWREHQQTKALVVRYGITRIVSDSRFGCFQHQVASVFMTHQLHPITGSAPVSWLYRKWLRYAFTAFWVPDYPDQRLSGELSDSSGYTDVSYIGPLSRLEAEAEASICYDNLALLSGPEPMRSHLEAELKAYLKGLPGKHLLVRGVPSDQPSRTIGNLRILDYADAEFLAAHLISARRIICRPGYSTLMDLAALKLKTKIVLVPTPGQTEQEYLAKHWAQTQVQGEVVEQGRFGGLRISKEH